MTTSPSPSKKDIEAAFYEGNPGIARTRERSALMEASKLGGAQGLLWAKRLAPVSNLNFMGQGSDALTALSIAARNGDAPLVKALLALGADPKATSNGYTALMRAVASGSIESVAALAPVSAIRSRDPSQSTALSLAAASSFREAIEILMPLHPANTAPTHFKNAANAARLYGNAAMAELILGKVRSSREARELSNAIKGGSATGSSPKRRSTL